MRTMFTTVALTFGLLVAGVSPAFAAKGVKKNGSTTHKVHGVVTEVSHAKGKSGNTAHEGEITVKVHQGKKKGQPAASGKKTSAKTEKFTVGKETQFVVVKGKQQHASSFAAVKVGEHVTVMAKGHHAESVVIHEHSGKKKPPVTPKKPK